MRFATWVFRAAGIYGLLVLLPMYLRPAPAGAAAFFYGFIGIAVAWQVVFLIVSRDPLRYRLLMIPAILEKLAFGIPALLLYAQGRLGVDLLAGGIMDLVLAALFLTSFGKTGRVSA